ncbi:DUF2924 domain-containing protein [Sulfitobacter sp. TBRI5]|uniref:DUF2924 domain-containing protein n=1 Tax=Sulfitobacter sp. TBRI5 TaxID=2989732 RepID=UPI003D9B5072
MNGERFRSLSAIALRITGTNWSGPRFSDRTVRRELAHEENPLRHIVTDEADLGAAKMGVDEAELSQMRNLCPYL